MSEYVNVVITPRDGSGAFSPRWSRVYVRKSLDEICTYIEIETSPLDRARIKTHDKIQVRYTNDYMKKQTNTDNRDRPVATGYIDDIDSEISKKRRSLLVNARSAARDIIDSTWSGQIDSKDLLTIVKIVASKFSISCTHIPTKENGTKLIETFAWENESPWQKIIQAADNQGYFITSNQIGSLYVWPIGTYQPPGYQLTEGSNIISIRDHESGSEQFNTYVFKGANTEVTKTDAKCMTKRTLTINLADKAMDDAALKRRITTEMLRRRNRRIIVGVKGWGLSEDTLAQMGDLTRQEVLREINFLTPVKVPTLSIDDTMLVSQVEYRADAKSKTCDVTLAKPEAYR